ncbi:hypothetical protein K461DRAFT_305 [Myriangium duriaei CBS 260.36]|uniref:DUF676 domain-containing protein n=1 Tax=Myriangium duriaei CBS 260.36 TaxID=1168546 RepID=A0A9P4J803_9PEZI|nr:hypothetical protein K461DRAFT_305 [Myriangium duriaei CBS 260.36]
MRKTLLLVFIHGFKGGDDTFEKFPDHLKTLISDALPNINVVDITYPRYETRGDLHDCVARFKEWLQNKVIDLEVAAGTPSPTIDPSVRTILIGHSMGGIVAAETLLSIARDEPVPFSHTPAHGRNNTTEQTNTASDPSTTNSNLGVPDPQQRPSSAPPRSNTTDTGTQQSSTPDTSSTPAFFFPYIQGILAFDTPYLGIHPGVVAHGAEAQYNTASAAVNAYNSATKFFGLGGAKSGAAGNNTSKSLPPAAANGGGGGWGRMALYAGGAAALAAVGSAAYYSRDHISSGWNWVGSHLAFVGCLARGAELAQRVEAVVKLSEQHAIGFADFYTKLGKKEGETKVAGQILGEERTFCVVPKEAKRTEGGSPAKKRKTIEEKRAMKGNWIEAVNTVSEDEITAHRAMFTPRDHPGYYSMSDRARSLVVAWVDKAWYESSRDEEEEGEEEQYEPETEADAV